MLTFAADFWPLFWTVLGGGAALTVLASLLVATFSPTWFRPRRRPALAWAEPARDHRPGRELRPGRDHRPGRGTKAA